MPNHRLALPEVLAPFASYVDEHTTDLLVNGSDELWIDGAGGLRREISWPPMAPDDLRSLAARIVASGGRHLDHASPCVDVRLDGGIRVHAALPPVAVRGTTISIRIPRARAPELSDLVQWGMLDDAEERILRACVGTRSNLLITGAAGVGKTTLLSAVLAAVPHDERIVTIEDVAELSVGHPHVVALEARQANIEGAGSIELPQLVREALRMRPDRIVVGECRGAEVRDLLMALGTGHDGGAGTLHARSLEEVSTRLEALGDLAGLSPESLARLASGSIDVVVHLERRDGRRVLVALGRPRVGADGRLVVEPLVT
ncbi:CpaF family protein [Amnibacterium flavum]|uniref:Pilus assembly protein CpaF n=1 Tax=Amnibacterium flavum TaxID=2173173 RepID=A0A2V1HYX0_9MICO|nr:ATPase, T2SS/T4P/T4SS family [Amnibacterium flavum]PVZ95784.1 pilus assembly protein CpaF [Amnibacterium flavum]